MRFVWAVVAFVIAAAMIGAGIAQRTVFQGPSVATESIETDGTTAYTLVDGAVLGSLPGAQALRVTGDGEVFVSYGRTGDMRAWLADVPYTAVTLGQENAVETSVVPASTTAPTTETTAARTPAGSDLWLDEYQQTGSLTTTLQLPADMSVLVASDGTAPAPSEITVSWPIDNSTPWAGPLIAGGAIALLAGIVLYVLGIRHVRRSRRPRRKGLPLPVTEPISIADADAAEKGVISSSPARRSRGAVGRGRRALIAVPALGVSMALFAGCSADAWPQFAASESPSPSPTVIVPEGQFPPAVTENQAERIVSRIATTVAEADSTLDATAAATRLVGPALAERQTNYTDRKSVV